MTKIPALAIVFAVLFTCGAAFARDCPAYAEPGIEIVPSFNGPAYDNSPSMRELKAAAAHSDMMTDEQAALRSNKNARIGGLTLQKPSISDAVEIQTWKLSDESLCAQVSKLQLDLKIEHPVVYIAREFPVRSCSYNAVLEHEMKHVDAVRNFLKGFPPVAEEHLRDFLHRLGVVHVDSSVSGEEVKKVVGLKLKAFLEELETNLLGALSLMETRIDTPEEYARIAASCEGQTQKIFDAAEKN